MSTTIKLTGPERCLGAAPSIGRLKTLLFLTVLLLIAIESLTRKLHDRRAVTLVVEGMVQDALAIRHYDHRIEILIAGNSLIYDGISRADVQQSMGHGFLIHTAGIPGSTFFDWQYGLRSLFERGSQPEILVFGISPSQFLRTPAVTPLPVARLWRIQEIFSYYREQHPNLTALSNLLLEHYSVFFYMRDTLRIYVRKAIPGYESMINGWNKPTYAGSKDAETRRANEGPLLQRLAALQSQCQGHSRLLLIIVPTNQAEDAAIEPALRSAAEKLKIAVVEPVHEREWPLTSFQPDGYHLTAAAARRFSYLAGAELARILKEQAQASTLAEADAP